MGNSIHSRMENTDDIRSREGGIGSFLEVSGVLCCLA